MPPLKIEANPDGASWIELPLLLPGDRYGSLSDNKLGGRRDIYVFGINPIENRAEIRKALAGIDIASPTYREIRGLGLVAVADLAPGESYELNGIRPGNSSSRLTVRFTHLTE